MDASSSNEDPICDRLPPELAMLIFGHLDLRVRMNARLVNQRWNEMALDDVQLKLRMHANSSRQTLAKYIPATTTADFIQRGSSRSIEPRVEVPGASLNEQIKQLPKALMARVFDIELRLEEGCVPAAGILNDIVSSVDRPIKLHLDLAATRLTPSMFTTSEMAGALIVEQLPTIQLQSLSAVFEFPANGDYSALNYFRMDKPSKHKQNIKLKLEHCGQSSNELPFVIERFPQLTDLKMEFGEMWDSDKENQFRAAPDWQTLPQLASLQKLKIKGNSIPGLCAPKLSTGFGLPELRMLRIQNVKLSASGAFQGTPKLNSLHYGRCEHENNGNIHARADIQAMTSAMRNGHLKQLEDVAVGFCTDNIATSIEYFQLVCKAITQNSHACPKFQKLTWAGGKGVPMMASNEPDAPSLCKALIDLPTGILSRRPFTLEMQCDESEIPDSECNELINALHAAVQQSGLKRLKLPKFRLTGALTVTMICDLINAKPPLSATIDGDNVLRINWTHPTIEGYDQHVEVEMESAAAP